VAGIPVEGCHVAVAIALFMFVRFVSIEVSLPLAFKLSSSVKATANV
jgi:hypothetical protein